jgi:hypothetical protein
MNYIATSIINKLQKENDKLKEIINKIIIQIYYFIS